MSVGFSCLWWFLCQGHCPFPRPEAHSRVCGKRTTPTRNAAQMQTRSSCGQFYELGFGARRVPLPGAGLLPGNNCTNLMAPLSLPCRENREDPDGVPPLLRGPVWCGSLQQHATRDRGHRGATGPAALAQGERCWARGRAASMASVSHCCWMVSKGRTRLLNRQVTWWWCRGPFSTVGDSPGPAPSSAELGL